MKSIVSEALKANSETFRTLTEEVKELMQVEGEVGRMTINGRLVKLKPYGEALILSDIHGDLDSLVKIFDQSNFLHVMQQNRDAFAIFLGDYGDRGVYSAEVYYVVLKLKLLFPEQVILLRGNHEGPEDLPVYPSDMPVQFQRRFGRSWLETYNKVRQLFNFLYTAVIVEGRYLLLHGGPPYQLKGPEDLAYAHKRHPMESLLEDILWSDPCDALDGVYESPRGAGKLFSKKVTFQAINNLSVNVILRGHEPCLEGFKIDHDGHVLTIFSRKGPPYFNRQGAYLKLNLSLKISRAEELAPYIYKI
ncbi:MAG: metallophosphoesterase [Candidatus Bathyarchaeia archaeon]